MKRVAVMLVVGILCAHGSTSACPPPTVVIDDRLSVGVPITAITLDSTHFAERTLLVGTDTSADGRSFVVRVSGLPLQITDTVAVFASRVRVIRAAMLDADSIPDWLIGLDSNVVRILGGPGGSSDTIPLVVEVPIATFPDTIPSDTIFVPGIVHDIEVYPERESIWIGYGATVTYHPSWSETIWRTAGGLRRFDALAPTGTELMSKDCACDVVITQSSVDTGQHVIVYWSYRSLWQAPMADGSQREQAGYAVFGVAGDTISYVTLLEMFDYYWPVSVYALYPVAVADMTGDDIPEYVYAYDIHRGGTDQTYFRKLATDVYPLGSDTLLWTVDGRWPASIWELTGDGLPDVLLYGGSQMIGRQGSTGDSLFCLQTDFSLWPTVTGTLDESARQRGVVIRADTLLVYHLEGDGYDLSQRPLAFTLHSTYPNPFNQGTTIHFTTSQIGGPTVMRLSIHNILGRRVRSLGEQPYSQGDYRIHWDGRDDQGRPVPSGVYLVMLRSGDDVQATKMMLLK